EARRVSGGEPVSAAEPVGEAASARDPAGSTLGAAPVNGRTARPLIPEAGSAEPQVPQAVAAAALSAPEVDTATPSISTGAAVTFAEPVTGQRIAGVAPPVTAQQGPVAPGAVEAMAAAPESEVTQTSAPAAERVAASEVLDAGRVAASVAPVTVTARAQTLESPPSVPVLAEGTGLSSLDPQSALAPEAPPSPQVLAEVSGSAATLVQTVFRASATAVSAPVSAAPARESPSDGVALTSSAPLGHPAPGLAPPALATVAALAWSGGDGATVDPASIAAIQSFMRAGDLPQGAVDAVRDGIGGLLASVPCARLQTVFDPASGALELRGHVPEEGLRGPVLAALQARVGAAIPVADNVRILPRPQCGALAGIAAVGLPQSEAQESDPKVVGAGAHARVYTFRDGERLEFELQGPDYPAFFYIDYFDAKGSVLHLQPNEFVPLEAVGIKEILTIGSERTDKPSISITVAPPFGQEIMVAFVASEPLFEGLRPIEEAAGPYLEALTAAVAAARAREPDFKGEWVYFFVETLAR
ncbi:MAG: DUF4384 domain-containing protein, partial [Pseudomonadota bacterium]